MYLPANGVRALRALGLEAAVAGRAAPIPSQRLLDHRGRLLADIDLRELWGDVGPCLALPRVDLHQVLREGVPVRLGRTVGSLERVDGPVGVGFDDGGEGEFDLVVGADGLHSAIRRLAGDRRPPVAVGQQSWRFLAACPPEVTTWTVLLGRGASFLAIPVGGGAVYCYADTTDGNGNGDGDPVGRLRERFAGFAAPVPGLLEQLDDPDPPGHPPGVPRTPPGPPGHPPGVPRTPPGPPGHPPGVPRTPPGPPGHPLGVPRTPPGPPGHPLGVPRTPPDPPGHPLGVPRTPPDPPGHPLGVPRTPPGAHGRAPQAAASGLAGAASAGARGAPWAAWRRRNVSSRLGACGTSRRSGHPRSAATSRTRSEAPCTSSSSPAGRTWRPAAASASRTSGPLSPSWMPKPRSVVPATSAIEPWVRTRPACTITTRSQTRSTSPSRWVETSTSISSSPRTRSMRSSMSSRPCGSMPSVGSSRSRRRGSWTSATASLTRCCMPVEKPPMAR